MSGSVRVSDSVRYRQGPCAVKRVSPEVSIRCVPPLWVLYNHEPDRGLLATQSTRVGDGGVRPCMDDSDGMGVRRGARRSPAGDFCQILGKSLKMYENAPKFTHLEHCHCRFRRRILTFHNRISSSSSHSFRNPLYEAHFLSLVNTLTQLTGLLHSVLRL